MSQPDTQRLEQLLQFHDRDPNDAFITYGIAMEYVKAGNPQSALEWFDRTLKLDPDYAYAHYQKAKLIADEGGVADAKAVIAQGIAAAQRKGDSHAAGELQALGDSL